ncbi:hypothetical protein M758_8G043900 [Ceratodon purpureus]|nr:hypothetical protein M758_8G043900 [Ceratodon purpureus]
MGAEALDVVDSKFTHGSTGNKVEAVDSEKGTLVELHHKRILKRRKLKKCCTWCGIPLLVVAIVLIVLSQTIFKFRDPDITLSNVHFSGVKIDYTRPLSPSSVNASLSANMNVYNPNHYNFKFTNSTIHVIYHDVMVGNISMPAGELRPGKSVALPALVTVGSLKLGNSIGNLSLDFKKNELPFAMSVNIPGRVNVVHIFKHDVVLEYHCDVTFWVGNSSMKDYLCWKKVHL